MFYAPPSLERVVIGASNSGQDTDNAIDRIDRGKPISQILHLSVLNFITKFSATLILTSI